MSEILVSHLRKHFHQHQNHVLHYTRYRLFVMKEIQHSIIIDIFLDGSLG